MQTVNLLIKGKVQGVYYRNAAKEQADKLGVTGWVKYISDGRVEAMASGNEKQLQEFIQWCRRGPEKAIVTDVIITPLSQQQFNDFSVILEDYPHDI
ncbi:MAG TPA: acylphosphatase [Chitinophagaceae bacterium]